MVHSRQSDLLHAAPSGAGSAAGALGNLPEWNLADLYPSMDSDALKRDLAESATRAHAFEAHVALGIAADEDHLVHHDGAVTHAKGPSTTHARGVPVPGRE